MVVLQVPGIVIFKANAANRIANVTIDKQINTPFLFFAFLSLFCFGALGVALSRSRTLCVCSSEASCVRYARRGDEFCGVWEWQPAYS